jgi:hypothetical protein
MDGSYISYLPMAHTFEVCMQLCIIIAGASAQQKLPARCTKADSFEMCLQPGIVVAGACPLPAGPACRSGPHESFQHALSRGE